MSGLCPRTPCIWPPMGALRRYRSSRATDPGTASTKIDFGPTAQPVAWCRGTPSIVHGTLGRCTLMVRNSLYACRGRSNSFKKSKVRNERPLCAPVNGSSTGWEFGTRRTLARVRRRRACSSHRDSAPKAGNDELRVRYPLDHQLRRVRRSRRCHDF